MCNHHGDLKSIAEMTLFFRFSSLFLLVRHFNLNLQFYFISIIRQCERRVLHRLLNIQVDLFCLSLAFSLSLSLASSLKYERNETVKQLSVLIKFIAPIYSSLCRRCA